MLNVSLVSKCTWCTHMSAIILYYADWSYQNKYSNSDVRIRKIATLDKVQCNSPLSHILPALARNTPYWFPTQYSLEPSLRIQSLMPFDRLAINVANSFRPTTSVRLCVVVFVVWLLSNDLLFNNDLWISGSEVSFRITAMDTACLSRSINDSTTVKAVLSTVDPS